MNRKQILYNYICFEGNIGAGKTTYCQLLADELKCNLVLEQFAENPFLKYFYEDPERYSFTVELFFLTERHKQLQETIMKPDLFSPHTLADYTIIKSLLFAKMNLSNDEYKLFYKLYLSLTQHVKRPDIIIYLHRPIPVVQQHIMLRGREYEIHIKETYLEKIQQFYFDFFKNQTQIPVVIVDLQGKDFIADRKIFQEVQNIIYQPFSPGLHYKSIFNL